MYQYKVGEKVWYKYEGRDRVFVITEIIGNVAVLQSIPSVKPKIKTDAYLTELIPHVPCNIINSIGRPTCGLNDKR